MNKEERKMNSEYRLAAINLKYSRKADTIIIISSLFTILYSLRKSHKEVLTSLWLFRLFSGFGLFFAVLCELALVARKEVCTRREEFELVVFACEEGEGLEDSLPRPYTLINL